MRTYFVLTGVNAITLLAPVACTSATGALQALPSIDTLTRNARGTTSGGVPSGETAHAQFSRRREDLFTDELYTARRVRCDRVTHRMRVHLPSPFVAPAVVGAHNAVISHPPQGKRRDAVDAQVPHGVGCAAVVAPDHEVLAEELGAMRPGFHGVAVGHGMPARQERFGDGSRGHDFDHAASGCSRRSRARHGRTRPAS